MFYSFIQKPESHLNFGRPYFCEFFIGYFVLFLLQKIVHLEGVWGKELVGEIFIEKKFNLPISECD